MPRAVPSAMAAVSVTVPALAGVNLPFTMPAVVTPVVPASFTVQTIVLLVALAGATAAEPRSTSFLAAPVAGTPEISVTGTTAMTRSKSLA